MTCLSCGFEQFQKGSVEHVFNVAGRLYLVRAIPAELCERCGEPLFAPQVIERIRKMIQGAHTPAEVIEAEVLDYDAA